MEAWPPIDPPELRARLALGDDEFFAMLAAMTTQIGPRELTDELYAHALGYPWARPPRSFLLDGETVQPLEDLAEEEGVRRLRAARTGRWPLLAFGSNGAPERLALKLAHLPPEHRRLLVVAGDLHDFDVGASAHPTFYGAMPGTIFPCAGTVVRASVLWVTTEQLVALTWTEISYALGRLDGVRFTPDLPGAGDIARVYAFASRWVPTASTARSWRWRPSPPCCGGRRRSPRSGSWTGSLRTSWERGRPPVTSCGG